MMEEIILFTKEQFEAAKKDRRHVAILALDNLGEKYWRDFMATLDSEKTGYRLIGEAFVQFADAIEGKPFSLNPLDIVSIWTRAGELFGRRAAPKYNLATSLTFVYGTLPIASQNWKNMFRIYQKEGSIFTYLQRLKRDESKNYRLYKGRIEDILRSLDELKFFCNGTREDVLDLFRKSICGDRKAKEIAEEVTRRQKEPDGEFICEIVENWGNGIYF